VGVIYRGGKFLDGVLRTEVTIDGTDSTEKIAEMVCRSKYKDIRVIMLDGLGFAGFNLVDIDELFKNRPPSDWQSSGTCPTSRR